MGFVGPKRRGIFAALFSVNELLINTFLTYSRPVLVEKLCQKDGWGLMSDMLRSLEMLHSVCDKKVKVGTTRRWSVSGFLKSFFASEDGNATI